MADSTLQTLCLLRSLQKIATRSAAGIKLTVTSAEGVQWGDVTLSTQAARMLESLIEDRFQQVEETNAARAEALGNQVTTATGRRLNVLKGGTA